MRSALFVVLDVAVDQAGDVVGVLFLCVVVLGALASGDPSGPCDASSAARMSSDSVITSPPGRSWSAGSNRS